MKTPFFRKSHRCWYIKDDANRFIRLDPDQETAFRLWERMKALANYRTPDATIEAIFEAYLDAIKPRLREDRFDVQVYFLEAFSLHYGPAKKARTVTAQHVLEWVQAKRAIRGKPGTWSLARQRDAGQAVKRAISWAIRRGFLPFSDLTELEFTTPTPRQTTIDEATHRRLVTKAREDKRNAPFSLVLIALRLSGARPISLREVEARHFNGRAWIFHEHKTAKKTGKPLVIRCNGCLSTLTRILAHHRPSGPLFLNSRGEPWTKNAIVLSFRRIRDAIGEKKITAYSYRHAFATDALEAGESIATVAALLGHSSPAMVAQVYGHLDKRGDHLDAALLKMRKRQ